MAIFDKDNLSPDSAALMESLASILTVMLEKEFISSQDVVALLQRAERATNTGQVSQSTLARLEAALKLEELSAD